MEPNAKFYTKQLVNTNNNYCMLDNTFQLLPWTNIMTTSKENNDFSGMQIWYFLLQMSVEKSAWLAVTISNA